MQSTEARRAMTIEPGPGRPFAAPRPRTSEDGAGTACGKKRDGRSPDTLPPKPENVAAGARGGPFGLAPTLRGDRVQTSSGAANPQWDPENRRRRPGIDFTPWQRTDDRQHPTGSTRPAASHSQQTPAQTDGQTGAQTDRQTDRMRPNGRRAQDLNLSASQVGSQRGLPKST